MAVTGCDARGSATGEVVGEQKNDGARMLISAGIYVLQVYCIALSAL
jgi:hypothetical protein